MKLQIYANYHMRYVYGIYKFSCCLVGSPTKTQWWCVDINCMCVCVCEWNVEATEVANSLVLSCVNNVKKAIHTFSNQIK